MRVYNRANLTSFSISSSESDRKKEQGTHCNASSIRSLACRILFSPHSEGSGKLVRAERDTYPLPTI